MKKNLFILVICSCISAQLICVNQEKAITAKAESVTENEKINDFLDDFSSEIDRIETAKVIGGVTAPLTNGAINGYTVYGAMNALEYYYYRYYNGEEQGSERLQPSGSSCSGAYKIENDDNIYFASCFTIGRSGGQLVSAPHYSMNINFELVSSQDLGLNASDLVQNIATINNLFSYGVVFDVPSYPNNFLRIQYRGSGLLNSSSWQTGATSGYRIEAGITPNNIYPTVTQGYNWSHDPLFSTYNFPDNGRINLEDIFENITIDEDEPWEAYNTLIDVFKNRFPDMDLDYVPFHGAQYVPAEIPTEEEPTDPTEPAKIERTTLPNWVQPETEIIEITNESGEIIGTETEYITDTNGEPQYKIEMPTIPKLNIPNINLPTAEIPNEYTGTVNAIWETIYRILDESGIMSIIPFIMICGIIVFAIKFLGG